MDGLGVAELLRPLDEVGEGELGEEAVGPVLVLVHHRAQVVQLRASTQLKRRLPAVWRKSPTGSLWRGLKSAKRRGSVGMPLGPVRLKWEALLGSTEMALMGKPRYVELGLGRFRFALLLRHGGQNLGIRSLVLV